MCLVYLASSSLCIYAVSVSSVSFMRGLWAAALLLAREPALLVFLRHNFLCVCMGLCSSSLLQEDYQLQIKLHKKKKKKKPLQLWEQILLKAFLNHSDISEFPLDYLHQLHRIRKTQND